MLIRLKFGEFGDFCPGTNSEIIKFQYNKSKDVAVCCRFVWPLAGHKQIFIAYPVFRTRNISKPP